MGLRNQTESVKAISRCNAKCVICGWNRKDSKNQPLVEGAHIKPLDNDSQADVESNIIALCPNCHTEFDHYNFYIDPNDWTVNCWDPASPIHNTKAAVSGVKTEYLAFRQYLYEKYHAQ